ncbi:MAG: MFS transporter [Sporolactobacillus sp.]
MEEETDYMSSVNSETATYTSNKFTVSQRLTIFGFFLAVFIVGLDSFIISPLLPLIASSLSSNVANVGLGITLYAVFYAVGAPLIAPFSENIPRKAMILAGLILFTIATFLCGTTTSLFYFYVFRSLAGLGAAMFTPNVYAYIGGNFTKEKIGKVMGIVMAALSLSIAVGVPTGSFIATLLDWHWTFFCSSLFALLSLIIIIFFVKKDNVIDIKKRMKPWGHYKNILIAPRALSGLFVVLFWMYAFYAIYTYLGSYIVKTFNLSIGLTGLVFVAYGLSNFVSSFSGGWIGNAWGMRKTILVAGIVSCVAFFLLGVNGIGLFPFIILLAILAFAQGIGVPQLATFNATVLPESRATMTSLNSSFLYLGLTLGSWIGGILFERYSFTILGTSAVLSTIVAIVISQIVISKKNKKDK